MLSTILKQTSWSMLGSIFGFGVGFFVKLYLINAVGTEDYGKYVIGQTVVATVTVFAALALPQILLRFLPAFVEKKEFEKASDLASFGLQFLLLVGVLSAIGIMLFHDRVAAIFHDRDTLLNTIILISALYIPLSLYSAVITASYRSLLKIKEIVLYGTFILISLRAIGVFIVFSFSNNIIYFLVIEILSQAVVLFIMTKKFDASNFTFFKPFPIKEVLEEKQVVSFGKKMYFYALIGFAGGYTITLIMSISLPAKYIGVYSILTTLAGLTAFLLNNLNSVFAPVISKYHAAGEIKKLESLFKETTFIINIMSAPFIVLLILFSHDILGLYGKDVSAFTIPFAILLLGSYYNLFVGNSGMLLLMGGWESDEIRIKIANMLLVILFSSIFIAPFGLIAAVWINTLSAVFVNTLHVIYIKKRFGFTPWEVYSFFIFILTIIAIIYLGFQTEHRSYSFFEYIFLALLIPSIYWIPFYKKISAIIKSVKENR